MALSILDGNQSATTLSTILSSGQHITAHTVVSLGTQAITDMRGAVSGSVVSISNFPSTQTIAGTVTANNSVLSDVLEYDGNNFFLSVGGRTAGGNTNFPINISGTVTIGAGTVTIGAGTAQIGSVTASISGTVTAGLSNAVSPSLGTPYGSGDPYPVGAKIIPVGGWTSEVDGAHWQALSLTDGGALSVYGQIAPGTNRIGVVTIGAGTVTLGASTSQIGSVTASISNSVTIASLPAISGTVTANLAISSTVITSGSFSSLTSATLVPANPARKMATVYNLGAGQLFVNAGVTATTLGGGFMVALSSGDFYECNYTTTTLSAIFATAGTASWVSH